MGGAGKIWCKSALNWEQPINSVRAIPVVPGHDWWSCPWGPWPRDSGKDRTPPHTPKKGGPRPDLCSSLNALRKVLWVFLIVRIFAEFSQRVQFSVWFLRDSSNEVTTWLCICKQIKEPYRKSLSEKLSPGCDSTRFSKCILSETFRSFPQSLPGNVSTVRHVNLKLLWNVTVLWHPGLGHCSW